MCFVEFLIKVERFHDATCYEFNNARVGVRGTGTFSVSCLWRDSDPLSEISQRDDHVRSQVILTLTMMCTTYNDYQYQEKREGNEMRIEYPKWTIDKQTNKKSWSAETAPVGPRRRPDRIGRMSKRRLNSRIVGQWTSNDVFSVSWKDCSSAALQDDATWTRKDAKWLDCNSVSENPKVRCSWKNSKNQAAYKACKKTCCGFEPRAGETPANPTCTGRCNVKKGKNPSVGQCRRKSFQKACSHCKKCDDAGGGRRKLADEIPGTSRRDEHSHRLATGAAPVLVVFLGLFLPTALALFLSNRRNKRLAGELRAGLLERANRLVENSPHDKAYAVVLLDKIDPTLPLDEMKEIVAALESRKLVL